jgi:predicted acetyltransferase
MHLEFRKTYGPLPTSKFELVNDAGEVIGYTRIRHRRSCNDDLPPEAGNNVYYEVAEAHRGRGYGNKLMGLALAEAKRIGLEKALQRLRQVTEVLTPPSLRGSRQARP